MNASLSLPAQIYSEIDKAFVKGLNFKEVEVQAEPDLLHRLYYAMRLGNLHHVKVRLYFRALEGDFMVQTTVWSCDTHNICLKGGIWIPVRNILRVELY
ncbi:MAG: hypothetical protein Q8J69_12360 [Sphingobacteriaceae bacterium]|nr:hypothetical protein [Sphingobacteriaceae bacterium]